MKISLNLKVEIVKIELFDDICPITCRNFRELCEGHTRKDGHKISYTNTEFDRIVKGQFIQGGDIRKHIYGHESVSCSIFEEGVFNDESFALKHSEPGMLGMCKKNGLPNTNECQFYITLAPLSYMDKTNVVFGRIIEGMSVIN
jgi:cyclophilin family peptidyl-prolyl cis-trans isomerase